MIKSKRFLISVFVGLAVLSVSSFMPMSAAMGVPPGYCTNEYDGPITSFAVTPYSGVTLHPDQVKGGLTFEVLNTMSYTAGITIREPGDSSSGNSNPGQQWWDSNYLGFYESSCTGPAYPHQRTTITKSVSMPAILNPATPNTYSTVWDTYFGNTVTYNVYWVPSPNYDIFIGVANYDLKVAHGRTATTTIYIASVDDFSGSVTLMTKGPAGLSMSVSPTTITLSAGGVATSTLSITPSSFMARGTYSMEVVDTLFHCVTCTDDISVRVT